MENPTTQSECFDLQILDLDVLWNEDQEASADSPFASLGLKPDESKAYMQFRIQHAMPVVAGPTMKGNYLAYHPAVIGRSHKQLLHQQLNLEHRIKRYDPKNIPRDRIVGAIVAVHFPAAPVGGWKISENPEEAPHIKAMAAVFKQAEGVPRVLGDHQSSKDPWNNSIEVQYKLKEMGVYVPSTREIIPTLDELPKGMKGALGRDKKTGHLLIGKYRGEQLAMAPGGIDGTVHYQGVGMTKTPAEREAGIEQILASRVEVQGELSSLPAEMHWRAMCARGVSFLNARGQRVWALVKEVQTEGQMRLRGSVMEARPDNPILLCVCQGHELMRSLKSVRVG